MVNAIIDTIMGAMTAVFGGFGTSLTTLFNTLIYDTTNGLTPFAEWTLIFVGLSVGMGIVYSLLRKVL